MTEGRRPTPGPWTTKRAKVPVDGEYDYAIVADGQVIAEAFGRSGQAVFPDAEANARLIAAAPDLYEACKAALEWYGLDGDGISNPVRQQLIDALQRADGVPLAGTET